LAGVNHLAKNNKNKQNKRGRAITKTISMAQNEGVMYWEADEANTWQRAFLARGGGEIIQRESHFLVILGCFNC
jgi:hypothetical protein